MITVHHLDDSRSQRVLWLLEELGLDYEITHHKRDAKTMLAPPELREVHPLGKSPVVVDDGRTIAESGAIIEYLVERHGDGALRPAPGTDERLRYTYWLHFAEGTAMPSLLLELIFGKMYTAPMPVFLRPAGWVIATAFRKKFLNQRLTENIDFIESALARAPWFAGDAFTAADIQMSFPVEAYAVRFGLAQHPKAAAYLERIHARPAYQRALERGGPYLYA